MQERTIRPNGSVRIRTINNEPTLTQQQFKEQVDVNNIIAKYKKTGEITHLARKQGVFTDVSEITDYHDSLQKVMDAQSAFQKLPSHLRNRFENDPQNLLTFLQDPKNYDEGVKLGIFEEKQKFAPPGPPNEPNPKQNEPVPKAKPKTPEKSDE